MAAASNASAAAASPVTPPSRPGTGFFLPRNGVAQALQADDVSNDLAGLNLGNTAAARPGSCTPAAPADAAPYSNSSSGGGGGTGSRMCSGRLYSPQLPGHSWYRAAGRWSLEAAQASGAAAAAADRLGMYSSNSSFSRHVGVDIGPSMSLDMNSRSFSSPMLREGSTADLQLLFQQQQQQQQQLQRLGSSPVAVSRCHSGGIDRQFSSSHNGSPSCVSLSSRDSCAGPAFDAAAAAAAALAACEDDVCITASGWLTSCCQSGSAVAAMCGQHSSLLAAYADGSPALAPCYTRRSATFDDGGSSSSSCNGLLAFPLVLRPGPYPASSNVSRSPFAEVASAASAGRDAAAAACSDTYTRTPCSSCPGSSAYGPAAAAAAAGGSCDFQQQLWQMQLASASASAAAAPCPVGSPADSRLAGCDYSAPSSPAEASYLRGHHYSSHSSLPAASHQPTQQGRSYSQLLEAPADHFGVMPWQADAGCSTGGVSSLSAPISGLSIPAALEPMQAAMLQQGQDELDAIELQLQQLLQTRDQLAASRTVLLREQGPSGLARSPTHLQDSNRLQGPDPAAPHLALHPGSALGSTVHPASAASHPGLVPQPRANALQSYMVLHQEQQQRHQLCMQYVSQNAAARGGSLSPAAQGKLYELLRLQKLQVGLHEELLHNLVACATLNSSSSSSGGCVGM